MGSATRYEWTHGLHAVDGLRVAVTWRWFRADFLESDHHKGPGATIRAWIRNERRRLVQLMQINGNHSN